MWVLTAIGIWGRASLQRAVKVPTFRRNILLSFSGLLSLIQVDADVIGNLDVFMCAP
jgi:hypothetical protein